MDGVTTNFIWPSDIDRAESDELNRVCEYAEGIQSELERLQQQNNYLSALASGQPLYGLEEKIADLMQRNKGLREEVERLRELAASQDVLLKATSAELSQLHVDHAALEKERDQYRDMAGCMELFRRDMIEAGVVGKSCPPMFMTEGVMACIGQLRAERDQALASQEAAIKSWTTCSNERNQLKAILQQFMSLNQHDRDLPLELFAIQRSVSAKAVSLANHDADVINQARAYAASKASEYELAEHYDWALVEYAELLRQQAKEVQ